MPENTALRKHLLDLLRGGNAHATFDEVIEEFPVEHIGTRPPGFAHSAWQLMEHLRIAQADILRFSASSDYKELKWPDDYWPDSESPGSPADWRKSIEGFKTGRREFEKLLHDPTRDLFKRFPWGDGQDLLREALVLADHNSWHLAQLMLLRRALGF